MKNRVKRIIAFGLVFVMIFTNNSIQGPLASVHAYDGAQETPGMLTPEGSKGVSSPDDRDQAECYYEDSQIRVTADGQYPSTIPDDARLLVTPVSGTKDREEYAPYMEALDQRVQGPVDLKHTLLYDIAIMVPQKDGTGLSAEQMVEYEPGSGTVDIRIELKQDQLTRYLKAQSPKDILVHHMFRKEPAGARIDPSEGAGEITVKDIAVEKVSGKISFDKKETVSFRTRVLDVFALTTQKGSETEQGDTRAAEDKGETPGPAGGESSRDPEETTQAAEDKKDTSADPVSMPAFEDSRKIGDITVALKQKRGSSQKMHSFVSVSSPRRSKDRRKRPSRQRGLRGPM